MWVVYAIRPIPVPVFYWYKSREVIFRTIFSPRNNNSSCQCVTESGRRATIKGRTLGQIPRTQQKSYSTNCNVRHSAIVDNTCRKYKMLQIHKSTYHWCVIGLSKETISNQGADERMERNKWAKKKEEEAFFWHKYGSTYAYLRWTNLDIRLNWIKLFRLFFSLFCCVGTHIEFEGW